MKPAHLILAGLFLFPAGCLFSSDSPDTPRPQEKLEYLTPNTPENALANLGRAYRNRDLESYASILAPEFEFRFPETENSCTDAWDRDFEIRLTAVMFSADRVLDIHVLIEHLPAVPAGEEGMEGTMRILTTAAEAEVAQRDGLIFTTSGDLHEFFFRPGREEGENGSHWYLVRWNDVAGPRAPAAPEEPTPVLAMRWWEIKCRFIL